VIHRNYDSIEACRKMQQSWFALNFTMAYSPKTSRSAWVKQFDDALAFASNNITESGEREKVARIGAHWKDWKTNETASPALIQEMNERIEELTRLNEDGMFALVARARHVRINVLIGVALFFLCCLIVTLFGADAIAIRLSKPLKEIAEGLRSKPRPGEKLRLPEPTSLELMIVIEELRDLWNRISQLDRHNVDRVIRQSSHLESLLSSVEDAVLVFDAAGRITQISDRMAVLLELPPEFLKGTALNFHWNDLPTTSNNFFKVRQAIIDRRERTAPVIDLLCDNHHCRSYAVRFRPVIKQGPKGEREEIATIVLLHDITEIRQHDRLKAEFISVLSHELKTPIQSLGTATELLSKKRDAYDERTQILVDTLIEDVNRIRAVANQFMQLGQISSGAVRIKKEETVLSDLLPEWIKPFVVLASDKNIKINYQHQGSTKIIANIDRIRFPWIVSNLLSNAIRISPEHSTINVLLTDRENYTEIRVSDEGPGIPDEVQRRMFEPFFQGTKASSVEIAGSGGFLGLGLTIVKEVTEAHEGVVEYHQVKPNGSCFRILLPLPRVSFRHER